MSIEDRLRHGLAREASTTGVEEALERTFRRQRKSVRRRLIGGVVLAVVLAAMLPWAMARDTGGREPVTATPEASAGFEGSWVSHLNRGQVVRQIKAAGLGRWVKPFLAHERLSRHQTFVYTFDDNGFEVADFQRGGGWHVGWEGSVTALPGQQIMMHDDFSGATDIFRWSRDGDRLHLERVSADTSKPYDIPYQVFDAAYMSGWWVRTDCALQTGQDC